MAIKVNAGFFNGLIDDVRFYDGPLDSTEIYDLYKLTSVCGDANHPYSIGDLDHDCRVNWSDFAVFAAHWAEAGCVAPTWCGGADLNQGGEVTWGDFGIFAAHWLECTAPECD